MIPPPNAHKVQSGNGAIRKAFNEVINSRKKPNPVIAEQINVSIPKPVLSSMQKYISEKIAAHVSK